MKVRSICCPYFFTWMIHWCTCQIMTEAEHGRLTLLHRPLPEYIVHTVSLEHSMLWYGTTSVLPTIHVFIAEIICYPSVTVQKCWQHCMICTMVVIVKKRTLTMTLVVCHWDDFPLSIFHLVTTVKLFLNARKVQNFVWKWKNDLRVFLLTNNQYCLGLPI